MKGAQTLFYFCACVGKLDAFVLVFSRSDFTFSFWKNGFFVLRIIQLADKSAYHYYVDFAERGYYNRLISGNINQVVHVDSVVCDFARYPYKARTYARQMIIRESNVTERSLVTTCSLQNTGRSDDNPNGFIIEQFTILENRDIRSTER